MNLEGNHAKEHGSKRDREWRVRAEQRRDGRTGGGEWKQRGNFKEDLGVKLLLWKSERCGNENSCSATPRIIFLYFCYWKGHFLPSFSDVSADDALLQMRPSTADSPLQLQPLQDLLGTRTSWTPEGPPCTAGANTSSNTAVILTFQLKCPVLMNTA